MPKNKAQQRLQRGQDVQWRFPSKSVLQEDESRNDRYDGQLCCKTRREPAGVGLSARAAKSTRRCLLAFVVEEQDLVERNVESGTLTQIEDHEGDLTRCKRIVDDFDGEFTVDVDPDSPTIRTHVD